MALSPFGSISSLRRPHGASHTLGASLRVSCEQLRSIQSPASAFTSLYKAQPPTSSRLPPFLGSFSVPVQPPLALDLPLNHTHHESHLCSSVEDDFAQTFILICDTAKSSSSPELKAHYLKYLKQLKSANALVNGVRPSAFHTRKIEVAHRVLRQLSDFQNPFLLCHDGSRILAANEAACELFNRPHRELEETRAFHLVHPDDALRFCLVAFHVVIDMSHLESRCKVRLQQRHVVSGKPVQYLDAVATFSAFRDESAVPLFVFVSFAPLDES
eukprot:GILJ01010058.1.p1 GENE.GILJ01010058.1~~GILJ01010058.1.p1  ORF type:complete len:272 (-),score=26.41 GILJ01010058.1:402-1217(-)